MTITESARSLLKARGENADKLNNPQRGEEKAMTVTFDFSEQEWALLNSLITAGGDWELKRRALLHQVIETFLLEQGDRSPPLSEDPT